MSALLLLRRAKAERDTLGYMTADTRLDLRISGYTAAQIERALALMEQTDES